MRPWFPFLTPYKKPSPNPKRTTTLVSIFFHFLKNVATCTMRTTLWLTPFMDKAAPESLGIGA